MDERLDLSGFRPEPLSDLGEDFSGTSRDGETFSFNNYFALKNGKPMIPVSGEFHFSRMDPERWEDELIKMRLGGINTVSTYIFWNHIEEEEGVFDFSGRRDLRRFVRLCGKHGLYVILRVGPFAHGEVRNGGLPDWLYGKPFEVRTTEEGFLRCVRRLYEEIAAQVRGLFFRDGGPVTAVQLDNEYMHSSAVWEMTTGISDEWVFRGGEGEKYILALRDIALSSGLTPVFFTGTAWGGAAYSPRVLPLWGGYPYRPWLFYSRRGEHPATEEYLYEDYHHRAASWADDFAPVYDPQSRPYACCEMGGGMMCSYYYRFIYPYKSVDALANVKLGSGCNFLGYYMFHGGTNPLGKSGGYMNEAQVSKRSYDYQAALGEFGQVRESYSRLKALHFFSRFFGDRLAPMETVLPESAAKVRPEDTEPLRWAVRTDGKSGFLFICNFQDHRTMPERKHETVRILTDGETYDFDISAAPDENAVLPFAFDMDGILLRQADAQPVLRTVVRGRPTYVFLIPDGMDGTFRFEEEARIVNDRRDAGFFTVRKGGIQADVLTLTRADANRLFLLRDGSLVLTDGALLEDEQGGLRLETENAENILFCYPKDRLLGSAAVPLEELKEKNVWGAYRAAAEPRKIPVEIKETSRWRWTVKVPENALSGLRDVRLQIVYLGDIGSLFLDNEMISDNFCNGDVWEVGLLEHRDRLDRPMTLRISPIREGVQVSADSPMAARSEAAGAVAAELRDVHAQPVYQIRL